MVVMDRGRVLAVGNPDEIKSSRDERVKQFLRREADPAQAKEDAFISSLLGK
jgi:phospholipid/cholesterol/gamma-HCH transport system ATP-binding protein